MTASAGKVVGGLSIFFVLAVCLFASGSDAAVDISAYDHLSFWVNGGSAGGQQLNAVANGNKRSVYPVTAQANTGTQINLPLSPLASPANLTDIYWQDSTDGAQPTFHPDDISLSSKVRPGVGPNLSIDVSSGRHAISDDIYGMNFPDEQLAGQLRLPVGRWGGNSTTRYNWETSMENTGSDWYFENLPVGTFNIANLPDGSASDQFVEQDIRTGTRTLLTIPLIGLTVKNNSSQSHPYDCGFRISKYGAQQSSDPWDTDCGDGLYPDGSDITGNDPTDTSTQITPDFEIAWIGHLTAKYGTAANGGVSYYDLDNEPMLWFDTHRDIHPQPATYDEMRDRTYQYAPAIKAADPTAKTLGPVAWGWCEYFYSALDGCSAGVDDETHNNTPYVAWYLQQMSAYEQQHGQRILDYLDLHYYPQANGVALSAAGDAATQALRLRSTRSLWDPSYIDESWISDTAPNGVAVRLVPRMHDWVTADYPGTKLSISEYNWGGLEDINGALAQADVLGILGREGVDLATLWSPPTATQPGAFAFFMYRNYDGAGHGFGDIGVLASSANQSSLAVYAAQRSVDSAVTVLVINKTANALTSTVTLAGLALPQSTSQYQYSSSNLSAIQKLADRQVSTSSFSATFPGNSITLFLMTAGGTCTFSISPTTATFTVTGGEGSVNVAPSAGSCSGTVTSNVSWITITSGSSITGKSTVEYSVSMNTTGAKRIGTITIAGQTFTVAQKR